MLTWVLDELRSYQNAKIYGFDTLAYNENINNYKDLTHYNNDMNSLELQAIKEGKHIVTRENVDEYFNKFKSKIENYDLSPFVKVFEENELKN